MTKQTSGRKAYSNGADFEAYLEDVEFAHLLNEGFFRGSLFAMPHGATIAICPQPPPLQKYFADL